MSTTPVGPSRWIRRQDSGLSPPVKDVENPGNIFRRGETSQRSKRPRISIHPQQNNKDKQHTSHEQAEQREGQNTAKRNGHDAVIPATPRSPGKVPIVFKGVHAVPSMLDLDEQRDRRSESIEGEERIGAASSSRRGKLQLLPDTEQVRSQSTTIHRHAAPGSRTHSSTWSRSVKSKEKQSDLRHFLERSRSRDRSPTQKPSPLPRIAHSLAVTQDVEVGSRFLKRRSGTPNFAPLQDDAKDSEQDNQDALPRLNKPKKRKQARHSEPVLNTRLVEPAARRAFQSGSQAIHRGSTPEGDSSHDVPAAFSESPEVPLLSWQKQNNPRAMNHLRQLNGISITETQEADEINWLRQEGLYVSPKSPGGARAQTLAAQAAKKAKRGAGAANASRINDNASITGRMVELQPSLNPHRGADKSAQQSAVSQVQTSSEEELRRPPEALQHEQPARSGEIQQQNGEEDPSPDPPSPSPHCRRADLEQVHQTSPIAQTQAAITHHPAMANHAPSSSAPQSSRTGTEALGHTSPEQSRRAPVRCHPETLMFAEQGKKVYAFETYVGRSASSGEKPQQSTLPRTPSKRGRSDRGSAKLNTSETQATRGRSITPPGAPFSGTYYGSTTSPATGRQSSIAGDDVETQPLDGLFEESQPMDSRPQSPARIECPEETQVLAYNSEQDENDDEATQPLDYTPLHTDTSELEEAPRAAALDTPQGIAEGPAPPERPHDPVGGLSPSPLRASRASNRSRFVPLSPSAHRRAFAANQAAWDGVHMNLDNGRAFDSETFDLNASETMQQDMRQSTLNRFGFSGGNNKPSGEVSTRKVHRATQEQRVWKPLAEDVTEDLSEDELTTETLPHVRAERREVLRYEKDRRDALRLNHRQAQAEGLARQTTGRSTRSGERTARASSEDAPASSTERQPLSRKTSTNQSQPSSGSTGSDPLPVLDRLRGMLSTQTRKAFFEE